MSSFKSMPLTAAGLLALSCLASPLAAGADTTLLLATAKASDAATAATDPAVVRCQVLVTTFQTADMKTYASVRMKSSTDMESVGASLGQETAMRAMKKYLEWKKTRPK